MQHKRAVFTDWNLISKNSKNEKFKALKYLQSSLCQLNRFFVIININVLKANIPATCTSLVPMLKKAREHVKM